MLPEPTTIWKKDGVSYYLIEDEHAVELKKLCAELFGGSYV